MTSGFFVVTALIMANIFLVLFIEVRPTPHRLGGNPGANGWFL
jgi:hypothetical protein